MDPIEEETWHSCQEDISGGSEAISIALAMFFMMVGVVTVVQWFMT